MGGCHQERHCPQNSDGLGANHPRCPASCPGQHHLVYHPRNGVTWGSITPGITSPPKQDHPRDNVTPGMMLPWSTTVPQPACAPRQVPRVGAGHLGPLCSGAVLGLRVRWLHLSRLWLLPVTTSPKASAPTPTPSPPTRTHHPDPRLTTPQSQAGETRAGARSRPGCQRPSTAPAWPPSSASRKWPLCRGPDS